MPRHLLPIFILMLCTLSCFAGNSKHSDLVAAVSNKSVTVQSYAKGGLGSLNLVLKIKNLKHDTTYIRIPPGLHFKSDNPDLQDLFTVNEVLLALAPQKQANVQITGFCMQAPKHSPHVNAIYSLNGYAGSDLKGLAERLYKHEPLTENYGQMFVWAITDNRRIRDISIDSTMVDAAESVVEYIISVKKQLLETVTVRVIHKSAPTLEVFSKKAVLAFHNPVEQVATFKMYDQAGNELHTFFQNRKINRGIQVYEFATNDMIPVGSNPVYNYKVTNAAGKILAKMQVNQATEAREVNPEVLNFKFEYKLEKPLKEGRIRIYLQDGTLLEEFKRYTNLKPGNYVVALRFMHLYPANTQFIAKLEDPDGAIHKVQLVNISR